jgi:hypothetical protein
LPVLKDTILPHPGFQIGLLWAGAIVSILLNFKIARMKELKISAILSETGESTNTLNYKFSPNTRRIARGIIAFSFILALVCTYLISRGMIPHQAAPVVIDDDKKTDYGCFTLINPRWKNAGSGARIKSEKPIPLAYIKKPAHAAEMSHFDGTDCALEFQIESKQSAGNIIIKDVYVEVSSYKPLPKYEPLIAAPFGESKVLYVEIDTPFPNRNTFHVSKVITTNGTVSAPGELDYVIKKDSVETFVLRINPKKPGIYKFSCYCDIYCDNKTNKVLLNSKEAVWLFDGKYTH